MSHITKAAALLLVAVAPLAAQNLVNGSDFPITPPTSGIFAPGTPAGSYGTTSSKATVASLEGTGAALSVLGGGTLSKDAATSVLAIMSGNSNAGAASTEITTVLMAGGASSQAISEFLTAMSRVLVPGNLAGRNGISSSGVMDAVTKFNALINSITDAGVLSNPPAALLGFQAVLSNFVAAGK